MVDSDPENKNNPDNPETYTREQIEQQRARVIDEKIDKLIALFPQAETNSFEDDEEKTYFGSHLVIDAAESESVLRRFGYSKVEISRATATIGQGMPLYPWLTSINTFAEDGTEKEKFYIYQPTKRRFLLKPAEGAGYVMTGSDIETSEATTDMERMDPVEGNDMLPEAYQLISDQEYLMFTSIITGCEAEGR